VTAEQAQEQRHASRQAEPKKLPGRLEGVITAADTGKPLVGATVRVMVEAGPGQREAREVVSDAQGRYQLSLPLGQSRIWGLWAPPGYYTQDENTRRSFATSQAAPRMVQDFVLTPGAPWRVELDGVQLPADKAPFFTAAPGPLGPGRRLGRSADLIAVRGDAQGKAVLTIPPTGGTYLFSCTLAGVQGPYVVKPSNVEIDPGFDPRRLRGAPEPVPERKAVRLRDAAGRKAVIDGADVGIEDEQAVVRFRAETIRDAVELTFRGSVVDETGKPIADATATGVSTSGDDLHSASVMNGPTATTNAQGVFEFTKVVRPTYVTVNPRIYMVVRKPGFDGATSKEVKLPEVKQIGHGDFGVTTLKSGHAVRGKVVDEAGQPLQGALVSNSTHPFLYRHLDCRTDVDGRFVMPDLSHGIHKFHAQYGERSGTTDFRCDEKNYECVIIARPRPPRPRSGVSASKQPLPPPTADTGVWDLRPPTKEPRYKNEPKYALFVFGPKRDQRVWLVLDGNTLYVDRNGNGDLTEAGERFQPVIPAEGVNTVGNPGFYTRFDAFEFTIQAASSGETKFRMDQWIRDPQFVPKTDIEKRLAAPWLKFRMERAILWRKNGLGQARTSVFFMPRAEDAQVCAFDGPVKTIVRPEQVLQRGAVGCNFAVHFAVLSRPYAGAETYHRSDTRVAEKEPPESAQLEVEIYFPSRIPGAEPIRRKYLLKQRC
jgi:hypothetical protein